MTICSQSSENVSATRVRKFWEYVQGKFENAQELVIVTKLEENSCSIGSGMCEACKRDLIAED